MQFVVSDLHLVNKDHVCQQYVILLEKKSEEFSKIYRLVDNNNKNFLRCHNQRVGPG